MLLVWMFISSYTINHIFVKNFMFSNVYISVNTIFECLYMFLVENGAINWWRDPKCVQLRRKGGGVMPHAYVRTYTSTLTTISSFWQQFCFIVSCFICRNLPLFRKEVFVKNGYFSSTRSISIVMKQAFFTWNCFCKPKPAKTLLILIK